MIIDNATREDASLIADAILDAIGPEITTHLAGESHTVKDVHNMFRRLAGRSDTQYSYLNTRIASTDDGTPAGVCISYDGADLKRLRRKFFREAIDTLGWEMTDEEIEALPGETEPDEFYLDTLMVLPQFRGRGIAKALIADAARKAERAGKPLGLLCDLDNARAYSLYESVGFQRVGLRPFAGHDMYHMQMPTDARTSAPYIDETAFVPGHIDGKWGYFYSRGNVAIPFTYDWAWPYSEGMACVKKDGKWGYIDRSGSVVIPFIYVEARSFSAGRACVRHNNTWGYLDHDGNAAIPFEYDGAMSFSEGLAAVKKGGKWGFIDAGGNIVIPFTYDFALMFSEGLAPVVIAGKYGFVDYRGKIVIPCVYDDTEPFSEGVTYAKKDGKYGFIDTEGNVAIPFIYEQADSFFDGLAKVHIDGEEYHIDHAGNRISDLPEL